MNKIIIIGANAAGLSAAVNARKENPGSKITIISKELYNPYRRPAIPSIITGEITDLIDAYIFTPDYLKNLNIEFLPKTEVIELDLKSKSVKIREIGSNMINKLEYDSLVLCMGGYSRIPKLKGVDKKGVCTFNTYDDTLEIIKIAKPGLTAVVVGAGFVGLEIAESLMKKGLKVYFNVRSRILRRLLEPDFSDYLNECFEQKGLKMLTGESISEIGGNEKVEYVVIKGEKIETSLVVFGTGVEPNVTIAKNAGIELGLTGAIKVNTKMQTSDQNVYAAGDCAESPDLLTQQYTYSPVGSIAALAGAIAGTNAAGGNKETKGFIRAQIDKILGKEIISIGHSSTTAKEVNLDIKIYDLSEWIKNKRNSTLSEKYPVKLKIITDSMDKIVGAQVITQKYGSQYSYELLKSILNHKPFDEFINKWKPPLEKFMNYVGDKQKILSSRQNADKIGIVKWE
jgi:NADPH-dependent 2,4-dienoyl-CoA reductase/sulfur reductase-like enzyme